MNVYRLSDIIYFLLVLACSVVKKVNGCGSVDNNTILALMLRHAWQAKISLTRHPSFVPPSFLPLIVLIFPLFPPTSSLSHFPLLHPPNLCLLSHLPFALSPIPFSSYLFAQFLFPSFPLPLDWNHHSGGHTAYGGDAASLQRLPGHHHWQQRTASPDHPGVPQWDAHVDYLPGRLFVNRLHLLCRHSFLH